MALTPITSQSAERFNVLVIGRAGIGKTSLLRTIDAGEPVCTVSAEAGLLCVRDLVAAGQIHGFEIKSFSEFQEALSALQSPEDFISRQPADWQQYYQSWLPGTRWVFIDSLTEIAARCVEDFQRRYPDKKDSFNLWNGYTEAMTALVKNFRDLTRYNVVFTCLESVELDEVKRRHIAPDISGRQLKERLTSYFDEVLYMSTLPDANGVDQRVFFTQPHSGQPGKDRSGKLEAVELPNLAAIKTKILGETA